MSQIERVASNTPWEPIFGYVRKVKAGNWLAISGTTATDERGMIVGGGQMYVQARQALANIKITSRAPASASLMWFALACFVTDISRFAEVARAHKEVFGENPPASTLVEVKRLVHPDMLIEVEADAFGGASAGGGSNEVPTPVRKQAAPASKPAAKTPSRPPAKSKASKPKRRR